MIVALGKAVARDSATAARKVVCGAIVMALSDRRRAEARAVAAYVVGNACRAV